MKYFYLGLNLAKDFGIKVLKIISDFDLIILKVKGQFACKNRKVEKVQ
jgi:hypothetical protein